MKDQTTFGIQIFKITIDRIFRLGILLILILASCKYPPSTPTPSPEDLTPQTSQIPEQDIKEVTIDGDVDDSIIIQSDDGDIIVEDSSEEIIQSVEEQAVLDRLYDSNIEYIMLTAQFETLAPEETALVILGQDIPPIRVDFSQDGVILAVDGFGNFNNPLTPLSKESAIETGLFWYSIDFAFLRDVVPDHPLSNLTLRNLDNSSIQLLLDNDARERLSGESEDATHFSVSALAEVDGFLISLFTHSLDGNNYDAELYMPRTVPEKPGFVMMTIPTWKTMLEFSGESSLPSFSDITEAVDFLERENHLENWRGIWPDDETKVFFNTVHKIPIDEESIIFHPWNQRFVRLRQDFEDSAGCSVPGISAFYLPEDDFFYLFATVNCGKEEDVDIEYEYTNGGNTISLSMKDIGTIYNILSQHTILNKTWVEVEGNYIEGLAVLLPNHDKYLFLSSGLFYDYSQANPYDESKDTEEQVRNLVFNSITRILDLTPEEDAESSPPTPTITLVYEDNFNSSTCNWHTRLDTNIESGCSGEQYHVSVKEPGVYIFLPNQQEIYSDYFFQVEAAQATVLENSFYGIVFRYQDDNHFYFLAARPDGYIALFKNENGFEPLIDWLPSESLNIGVEPNLLGVVVVGSQIVPTINGAPAPIVAVSDSTYESGLFGLAVGAFPEDGDVSEFYFDNVEVLETQP